MSGDYYRQRQVRMLRSAMRYTEADYQKDWDLAIALAQTMAAEGHKQHLEDMLETIFERLTAYSAICEKTPSGRWI
jgi:RNase P protein component